MKKVYKFDLIPGVEFVEKDGFYYTASDDPLWPKSHLTKVIIDRLLEYEKNNRTLYRELTFAKKTIEEKDKEIKTHKNAVSVLHGIIESTKETAENERKHRDDLIKEKDEEIEALTKKLKNAKRNCLYLYDKIKYLRECGGKEINHRDNIITEKDEEIEALKNEIANNPISKSPVPLSSASDCSNLYICAPDHITYGHIAGGFGIGLYVGDTLILLKGDKANETVRERSSMTDRINTLETTLKKKDETIRKLRNTAEFANGICDGYGALTDTLMSSIEAKNSEIKVLSDQVTRLMDQLKEVMGDDTEFEQRVETETKPETNFDKMMSDMRCKSCTNGPEPCCDICGNVDCEYRIEECREGIIKEGKS